MSAVRSVLPLEMRGVAFFAGRRGFGKSLLASQADDPRNVLFIDYDGGKGRSIHNQLHFAQYNDVLSEAAGKGNVGVWDRTLALINGIQPNQFTVAVLDNVSPLELAMKAEAIRGVKQYAREFSLNEGNIIAGRFGGANSIVSFLVTEKICAPLYAKGVQLVVATAHVKPPWAGSGPIPNKWNAKGSDRWQELSILTLILVGGQYAPIPAALVQKEALGSIMFDETSGEFALRRRLPLRLPKATFAEIKRYLREPADLEHPGEGEVPSEEEINSYNDKLSKEQLSIMQSMLESERLEAETQAALRSIGTGEGEFSLPEPTPPAELTAEQAAQVLAAKAEGKNMNMVAKELGVTLPMVLRAVKAANGNSQG